MSESDRRMLINRDNIDNLCMWNDSMWWEIRLYYDGYTLARFDNRKKCVETFCKVIDEVSGQGKNVVFVMPEKLKEIKF